MPDPLQFDDTSPRWALPFLFAGQAQKEIFVNEALARLDMLIHPLVEGRQSAPPTQPGEGEAWIVDTGATGDWAGHDDAIACHQSGQWVFADPQPGVIACERTSGDRWLYASGWSPAPPPRRGIGRGHDRQRGARRHRRDCCRIVTLRPNVPKLRNAFPGGRLQSRPSEQSAADCMVYPRNRVVSATVSPSVCLRRQFYDGSKAAARWQ